MGVLFRDVKLPLNGLKHSSYLQFALLKVAADALFGAERLTHDVEALHPSMKEMYSTFSQCSRSPRRFQESELVVHTRKPSIQETEVGKLSLRSAWAS